MPQEFSSRLKSGLSKDLKSGVLRIGVLYGGSSSERKISLRSGRAVHRALRRLGLSATWVDPKDPKRMRRALGRIDLAFLALHGHGGEDGSIQKVLEKQHIPYIGSDARASGRAFDKVTAKKIFRKNGIPTPPWVLVNARNWKHRLKAFSGPLFVKPPKEGSSIGAFAVEDFAKGAVKIEKAAALYGDLLVEKKITGREFTVGILGTRALPVVELKPRRAFYDYRAKYTKGMTQYIVPARIPAGFARRLQKLGLKVHRALGLRDFSRVDILTDSAGRPYVLEANSIPGFTELSLLPKAARAAGISFEALCLKLVEWAQARKKRERIYG